MSLLQNEDFKTEAQITGAGGTASQLLNDSKIWVTGNSINKTLDDAIVDGDIGGGGSGINYIDNNEFKTNDTGWVEYEDAVSAVPVDGTGGTPESVFSRSTSSPLRGTASGLFAKPASNEQGEGVAYAFTIDTADQGKMLETSFDYTVTANYIDGYARVYLYDVTNSVLIEPSQRDILANSGQATYRGYWQAPSNSTSYRLIIHVSTALTTAWDLKIDNVKVGPILAGNAGTFVSDYQDFTLSAITGLASFSTVRAKYRRVGGNAEGYFEITASVDATATLALPLNFITGLTVNSALIGTRTTFGHGFLLTASNNYVFEFSGEPTAFTFRTDVGELSNTVPSADGGVDTGDRITCQFNVPITGWSTGVSASEISSNSVIACKAYKSGNQTISTTAGTTVQFNVIETDTSGSFNTGTYTYTIPESGIYSLTASIYLTNYTSAEKNTIRILINGSTAILREATGSSTSWMNIASGISYCNKGDTITVSSQSAADASYDITSSQVGSYFNVFKINNPAKIAPTEFVGCSYETNAGQSIANNSYATVVYEDRIFDTHNSMNTSTGVYTIPVSGNYEIYARLGYNGFAWTVGKYYEAVIRKNSTQVGAITNQAEAAATYIKSTQVSYSGSFVKGDTIDIKTYQDSGAARTLLSTGAYNQIIITKVS